MSEYKNIPGEIKVLNIGLDNFTNAFKDTNTTFISLDWKPPAQGDTEIVDLLFRMQLMEKDEDGLTRVERANKTAVDRIIASQPVLIGVKPAHEVFPEMKKNSIFHAGPPVAWQDMCGPMRGAFIGAIRYEGLAETEEEAIALMDEGKIEYGPNHSHGAVGPMTGIISYSMPVFVVKNETFGNYAYCTINEGLGEVMRFGANGEKVIARLKWLEKVLAPVLDKAINKAGGVNLKNVIAQALAMGDEMHQRNVAASLLFYRAISGELAQEVTGREDAADIVEFIAKKNDQFFLNLAMVASKAIMDSARDIPHSTVVTAMSRNGVEFGINVSGLGSRWFTAPVNMPQGLYFPGYTEGDANPDMGDSTIVECIGIGGFAMGCAPAVVNFVGAGSVSAAIKYSESMGEITVTRNANLPMPNLNFQGVATGVEICKVVETGILPVINTGIAHKKPGIGQVGAGIVKPPMKIFVDALRAFVENEGL
ncbi:MAG: DUF1116 domain-containing protein [Bacillota bacterium]